MNSVFREEDFDNRYTSTRHANGSQTGDSGSQASRRLVRFEKEVRAVLSTYFLRNLMGQIPLLTSITRVQMTADLRSAKIYVFIPKEETLKVKASPKTKDKSLDPQQERVLDLLEEHRVPMQLELGRQLKARYTPQIRFYRDSGLDKTLKVDALLHELARPTSSP